MTVLDDVSGLLERTLLADRQRLSARFEAMRRREAAGKPFDRDLARWQTELAQANARFETRAALVPTLSYPADLPIVEQRDTVLEALARHQVVIVCGETGSGKSTQLPKFCLELGRGLNGMIGHTQPRRIAARSIATRLAQELKVPLGQQVGYKVRFADSTSANTLIKLMTDGLLLAETQHDRLLQRYDTLIIDEAHERSLNIDFLLGYLHQLVPRRPDLKIIITSATIDAERFRDHFRQVCDNVPVLQVSGRMYPVEIRYRPPVAAGGADAGSDDENVDGSSVDSASSGPRFIDEWDNLVGAVQEVCSAGAGDVLVFLPTEREIHEAAKRLRGVFSGSDKIELLPLYARLSAQEQQRVFQSSPRRRIVLATNVAESSLTVPGIRYVVDTGTARISRYSPRARVQRLPIEAISQASANQRAGRCGRLGPGICIRLFSEQDFQQREQFTAPEILRSNLAAVVLQTMHLGLGPIEEFPFLEPPRRDALRDGYQTLYEIGAVTEEYQLTALGRRLCPLPVDPRIGRIVLAGLENHCLPEVLIIASALSVQDPRERPAEHKGAADQKHALFNHPDSDFLSLLKLWDTHHEWKLTKSRNQVRKSCLEHFLSPVRMQEWSDVHRELQEIVHGMGAKPGPRHNDEAAIHRALLTGFLSGLAYRTEQGEYLGTGSQHAQLWPGSVLSGKKPKWIFAAETVETSRRFLRLNARIDPSWIEPLAGHLLKYTHTEPHWDREAEATVAYERVTLLGLPIIPRRRIRYARVDAAKSRELFVQHGLVQGDLADPPEFVVQNQLLTRELLEWQARLRRPVLVIEEPEQAAYYHARLPEDVLDGQRLRQWWRRATPAERERVTMTRADLLVSDADAIVLERFPDVLAVGNLRLPLRYRHDPGGEEDGVTVSVPHPVLNQLSADRLEWLVPGMIGEKVEALLRTLPKETRRLINPITEATRTLLDAVPFGQGNLVEALATGIREKLGARCVPAEFEPQRVPEHLQMRLCVVDAQGDTLGTGRSLEELRQRFGAWASARFAAEIDAPWHADALTDWTCSNLPDSVPCQRGGVAMLGYPALVDQGGAAGLRLFDTAERALREHRFGVRRLLALARKKLVRQHVDHFPLLKNWTLDSKTFPQPLPLKEHLADLVVEHAFLSQGTLPRSKSQFDDLVLAGQPRVAIAAAELAQWFPELLRTYREARRAIADLSAPQFEDARKDLEYQLARLVEPGFLQKTPWAWLSHLPRYLAGITTRVTKLSRGGAARDHGLLRDLWPYWQRVVRREEDHRRRGIRDTELETARWLIEEYRVAVFAQELGTAVAVSPKRLDQQWTRVRE